MITMIVLMVGGMLQLKVALGIIVFSVVADLTIVSCGYESECEGLNEDN